MASENTLNQQDQYAQQQQQSAPKFNAFGGLQKTFQQQQSQVAPTPGSATQGLQGNVAKNQSTASNAAVAAGQGIVKGADAANAGFNPTPLVVGNTPTPLATTPTTVGTTGAADPSKLTTTVADAGTYTYADPTKALQALTPANLAGVGGIANAINTQPGLAASIDAKYGPGAAQAFIKNDTNARVNLQIASLNTQQQSDIPDALKASQAAAAADNADLAAQNASREADITNTGLTNTAKLAQEQQAATAAINATPSGDVIANIGQQNTLENRAAGQNQVLGSPTADSVAKLTAMFNPGYNASRYGGIDAGLYNQQVNQASQTAKQLNQQTATAAAQKQAAIGSYLGSQKQAQTDVNNFGVNEGNAITAAQTAAQQADTANYKKALAALTATTSGLQGQAQAASDKDKNLAASLSNVVANPNNQVDPRFKSAVDNTSETELQKEMDQFAAASPKFRTKYTI